MRKRIWIGLLLCAVLVPASYPLWKPALKRNKWGIVATNMAQDSLRRFDVKSGQIGQENVISLPGDKMNTELIKVRAVYDQYLRYAEWPRDAVRGKRIIELGPGYTVGVPLLFAADGAEHAVGIDKFVPFQTGPDIATFYDRLRGTLSESEKNGFDHAITIHPKPVPNPEVLGYIYGKELEDSVQELGAGSYDMIVSNAVMEEIWDPTPVFKAQDALLRPGGVMVHKIDLRDYGMFAKYGFDPLEFLTIPDWAYRHMVEFSGQPNRRLADYYRNVARDLGYTSEIYVVRVLGVPNELKEAKQEIRPGVDYPSESQRELDAMRPRLLPRYQQLSDADLATQTIIFVARKSGGKAPAQTASGDSASTRGFPGH